MAKKKSSSATRSGRGIFDPDYRKRGWNQSKYAPKNGGNNITQASALLITVLMSPCYCSTLVGYEDMEDPANTLAVLIVMSLIGWVLMAIWIRKREWKRLEALLTEQEVEEATTPGRTHEIELRMKDFK